MADKAEHKCVPGSVADAVDLSTRRISSTATGEQLQNPETQRVSGFSVNIVYQLKRKRADLEIILRLWWVCATMVMLHKIIMPML